jgi:hypothetical protein
MSRKSAKANRPALSPKRNPTGGFFRDRNSTHVCFAVRAAQKGDTGVLNDAAAMQAFDFGSTPSREAVDLARRHKAPFSTLSSVS